MRVSAPQAVFLDQLDTKYSAFVGGFGSGKTFVGGLDQAIFAGRHPKTVQGYFAPTYRDIRDTFWPTLDEAAYNLDFTVKTRTGNKECDFFRGSSYYGTVVCRSMDDPASIVGFKVARALVDEIDILSKEKATAAWRKIIARMRLVIPDVQNCVRVTTTPEGFKFVYDTFKRSPQSGRSKAEYSMVQCSTYENEQYLPPDYISSLLNDYPEELISAYLMGEFVNLTSGTVYREYNRERCRSSETIRPNEPLHIGQDFNVNNMASVINVEREDGYHVVGELKGGRDTPWLIDTINSKFAGHKIYIYPDASGGSRKTINASESDISLLRQAGYTVRAPDANPPVKDRILSVNAAYTKGKLWVNDRLAPTFAESQEQQAYDKNGEPDKDSGHDHHNDAQGYFVHQRMPVVKRVARVTGLRI